MSVSEGSLLGMGNPLLDISAHVKEELLTKYELEANRACLAEEKHLPIYNEMIAEYDVEYIAGGATQNSIRVAQWMINQPNASAFIGCVGKDEYADKLRAAASEGHVHVEYMVDEQTPTGTCAVLVTGDERTLVANISAANNYKVDHLEREDVWKRVEAAKVTYISGFFLTVSPPSIKKVGQHTADTNNIFCMNLAAPFICQVPIFKQALVESIPFCDFVFGNESEAEAFAESNEFGTKDVKEIALKIAAMDKVNAKRPRCVVITQGPLSTWVAVDGEAKEYAVDAIPHDQIVDTNGAGDAFVGGFLSQLVQEKPLEECVRAGHWAAQLVIQRSGCTVPATCDFE